MTTPLAALLRGRRAVVEIGVRRRHSGARWALATAKAGQREAWERQSTRAPEIFAALREHADDALSLPLWRRYAHELESRLLPAPPFDFLRAGALQATMVVRGRRRMRRELAYLRARRPPGQLTALLEEDAAGDPTLAVEDPPTSATAVHHAHHLERFAAAVGVEPWAAGPVVEWGGGYGGFARTLRRGAGAEPPAHVIIDLPVVATLQWVYLTTIFGEDAVDLVTTPGHRPRAGAITLVPAGLALTVDIAAALFVSTWALSEAPAAWQDAVVARDWFGARHLLLAFQGSRRTFPAAARVGQLARSAGATIEPTGVVRGSSYAFR